jgi:hypothetical protein
MMTTMMMMMMMMTTIMLLLMIMLTMMMMMMLMLMLTARASRRWARAWAPSDTASSGCVAVDRSHLLLQELPVIVVPFTMVRAGSRRGCVLSTSELGSLYSAAFLGVMMVVMMATGGHRSGPRSGWGGPQHRRRPPATPQRARGHHGWVDPVWRW